MTKKKIWITIIGSGIVASLGTAASFFPQYNVVLIAASTLVAAIMSFVNGVDNVA